MKWHQVLGVVPGTWSGLWASTGVTGHLLLCTEQLTCVISFDPLNNSVGWGLISTICRRGN